MNPYKAYLKDYLNKNSKEHVNPEVSKFINQAHDTENGYLFACIAQWHIDRNLIDGSTDDIQFIKLFEEFIELYASITGYSDVQIKNNLQDIIEDLFNNNRIKQRDDPTIADDIGDILVVLTNILMRNKLSLQNALEAAWTDIKDRKGKMIKGLFVKKQDL